MANEIVLTSTADELAVSMQTLETDLMAINAQIDVAIKTSDDLAVSKEDLDKVDYKDLKNFETALSKTINDAEECRKQLKRHWSQPLDLVTSRYKDAMEPVTKLHALYKEERIRRDDAQLEEKMAELEQVYIDFIDASGLSNLIELLPFERVWDKKWGNKSCSIKKAETELTQKVSSLIADWESLKKTQYHFPDEAQAEFWRTLNLREVNENDAKKWEESQALAALNSEIDGNVEYTNAPIDEYIDEPIIAEAESIVADTDVKSLYIIEASMTESQWVQVRSFMQSLDIHGNLKQVIQNV